MRGVSKFSPWIICLPAALFFFYTIVQLALFNVISLDVMQSLGISPFGLGKLSSSYLYVCAAMLLPAGWLFDRYSTKKLLLIASSLSVLGVFLLGSSFHILPAVIGRSLTGLGNAFAFLGCMRLVSRWFPPSHIALAVGLAVTIAMFGGIVAQTPFSLLVQTVGWREALFINAICGIVIVCLIVGAVRDVPADNVFKAQTVLDFLQSFKRACSDYRNWLCGFYTGFLNLPVMLLGALWGNLFLIQGHGFSATQAGTLTSLIFLGLIIGAPLAGWVSDRLQQRRRVMLLGALFATVTICGIIYISLPLTLLAILLFVLGLVSGAQVLSYSVIPEICPPEIESTCLGLVAVIVNGVGAGAQVLFSWIISWLGHGFTLGDGGVPIYTLKNYQASLTLMPVAFLLSYAAAFFMRETFLRKRI
jgi:MFS family permease